jgi:hypothetical protein
MAATKTKKWTKETITASIKKAAKEKGDVPTSTDMAKRLFGLPYPQAVINVYGSIPAAITDAGFEPKGKAMSKKSRAKIKSGMTKRTASARKQSIKKSATKTSPSPALKSAVATSLGTAFARQQFCPHCETTFVGDHSAEQCRDNLVERMNSMRNAVVTFLPTEDRTPALV